MKSGMTEESGCLEIVVEGGVVGRTCTSINVVVAAEDNFVVCVSRNDGCSIS